MSRLRLPSHLEESVLAGHPWVYRNQLPKEFVAGSSPWVEVQVGKVCLFALYDEQSMLALRIYSRERPVDARMVRSRVEQALKLRRECLDLSRTNAFRLINGEGDFMPGIVVDHYAGYCVVSLAATACEVLVPWLTQALIEVVAPRGIAMKRSLRKEGDSAERRGLVQLFGEVPDADLLVTENGLSLHADLHHGQKTGLFLDQRDNRSFVERHSKGRRVLNLFSYSGAFSLYAVRGGADHVTSVDSARPAVNDARRNFSLNGFEPDAHDFVVADVFSFLEEARANKRSFDFVICDPPSFGSQKTQHDKALQSYSRLFGAALKVTSPSALFVASSCTARVTAADLARCVARGAQKARREVQLFADLGHAPDHPIVAGHLEGRYLKFLAGRVEPRS